MASISEAGTLAPRHDPWKRMPDYAFTNLSPHEFEALARDLLQAQFRLRLESFTAGRDGGVDLRYAAGPHNLIVQCKHYAQSDWATLKRALEHELPKVKRLHPTRYVVATSFGLTPERKGHIASLFAPYCSGPSDVFGRDDLNNLLGLHPTIERQHYKLWLTSTNTLSRILQSGIYSEQQAELDSISRRVNRFVPTAAFPRALQVLRDNHFVVISGVPGIGKTTLAEMLLLEHASREYECFRIWDGVSEVRSVLERNTPQLFYFDDFLGRTGLRHEVLRNEDERLLRLLREVREAPNTRVVLTTREYILNQAREFMEAFRSTEIELAQCVVAIGDYSDRVRAMILYNHLYFSDVPRDHLDQLLTSRTYRRIVRHRNYNPRLLEAMTDALNIRALSPIEYPQAFLDALENPNRLWETAFLNHLSPAAQNALLTLTGLPDRVRLADAEAAFDAFHGVRCGRYGTTRSPYDWERALKELDGNFLKTELSHGEWLIEFHNPSVRDFLEGHISAHARDQADLLEAAIYSRQVSRLWEIRRKSGNVMDVDVIHRLAESYWNLRQSRSPVVQLVHYSYAGPQWRQLNESLLFRFLVLWDIATSSVPAENVVLERAAADLIQVFSEDPIDKREGVRVLECLLDAPIYAPNDQHPLYRIALHASFDFSEPAEIGEFSALTDFVATHGEAIPEDLKIELIEAFRESARDEEDAIRLESDFDTQLSWFEELSAVADKLGIVLTLTREQLEEDREDGYTYDDDEERGYGGGSGSSMSDQALDALFDSLRQ